MFWQWLPGKLKLILLWYDFLCMWFFLTSSICLPCPLITCGPSSICMKWVLHYYIKSFSFVRSIKFLSILGDRVLYQIGDGCTIFILDPWYPRSELWTFQIATLMIMLVIYGSSKVSSLLDDSHSHVLLWGYFGPRLQTNQVMVAIDLYSLREYAEASALVAFSL